MMEFQSPSGEAHTLLEWLEKQAQPVKFFDCHVANYWTFKEIHHLVPTFPKEHWRDHMPRFYSAVKELLQELKENSLVRIRLVASPNIEHPNASFWCLVLTGRSQ